MSLSLQARQKDNRIRGTTAETLQTSPREVTFKKTETNQINSKTEALWQSHIHKYMRIFKRFSHKLFVFYHSVQITVHKYEFIFKTQNGKNEVLGKKIITSSKYNSKSNLFLKI